MGTKKLLKNLLIKTNFQVVTKRISEKINFSQYIKINDQKFLIPIVKNIGYDNLIFADGKWKIDFLQKIFKAKKGVFVDVGANVGQTLLILKSVDAKMRYIGFEPNPNCVFYINYLIK